MARKKDVVSRYDGAVYTHRELMATAEIFLCDGERIRKASRQKAMAASIFAWLAFEAYLNYVLEQVAPDAFKNERNFFREKKYSGVLGKQRWLLDHLKATPPRVIERRRRVILELHRLRDTLVHAKPERFDGSYRHSSDEQAKLFLEDRWVDSSISLARARRHIQAVQAFCEWLHRYVIPPFDDPHLRGSAFKGVTRSTSWSTRSALMRK
jgi:hypothetical protein